MQQSVTVPARRLTWFLVVLQTVVAAAYFYGVVAFAATEAESFPEHAPPAWAIPAVLATLFGPVLGLIGVVGGLVLLRGGEYRAGNDHWRLLAAATTVCALMLVTMLSPYGWKVFDWYVS
ncbi:hypothetical protein Ait01nite_039580 [Actinoplanes italicus]|uniref:Uncharacterized protein n=1 Tax=Actinoplanes italicus TaxID=113567 RepID=A0A2T0JX08_9ACTN|nr:hypothetical protein [Actinoplanes italicus]PRX12017.1 hypothetical protein CLV67_13042 [Actinoplanes italicus]GIE30913.1 hypothetical protein Ait01nite_039580 [Actinoplanes italicus]